MKILCTVTAIAIGVHPLQILDKKVNLIMKKKKISGQIQNTSKFEAWKWKDR